MEGQAPAQPSKIISHGNRNNRRRKSAVVSFCLPTGSDQGLKGGVNDKMWCFSARRVSSSMCRVFGPLLQIVPLKPAFSVHYLQKRTITVTH